MEGGGGEEVIWWHLMGEVRGESSRGRVKQFERDQRRFHVEYPDIIERHSIPNRHHIICSCVPSRALTLLIAPVGLEAPAPMIITNKARTELRMTRAYLVQKCNLNE